MQSESSKGQGFPCTLWSQFY